MLGHLLLARAAMMPRPRDRRQDMPRPSWFAWLRDVWSHQHG
jgi:hypothetical protein